MTTKLNWETIKEYEDIFFDYFDGIGKITINREHYRNAFRPTTVNNISDALRICREDQGINVVVLTGAGESFAAGAVTITRQSALRTTYFVTSPT